MAQLIILPYARPEMRLVQVVRPSWRGERGFGSTNRARQTIAVSGACPRCGCSLCGEISTEDEATQSSHSSDFLSEDEDLVEADRSAGPEVVADDSDALSMTFEEGDEAPEEAAVVVREVLKEIQNTVAAPPADATTITID